MTALPAAPERLTQLREQVETLRTEREIVALSTELKRHEQQQALIEGWGDLVNPLEYLSAEPEYFGGAAQVARMDRPHDRKDGDNAPHWDSEQGLAIIRGVCDYIGTTDSTVVGVFQTLAGYAVKDGFTHTVEAEHPEGEQYVEAVQAVIDEFTHRVNWYGGVDVESFKRTRRQGERFLRVTDKGDGYSGVEFYEPSWITEPMNSREYEAHYGLPGGLNWKYGVVTDPLDASTVYGFFTCKYGDPQLAEFVPVDDMSGVKANVDRNVKRGCPDLYAGREWANGAAGLLSRVVSGAKIQSSIALVYKYPPATKPGGLNSAADSRVAYEQRVQYPGTGADGRSVPVEHYPPGKIVDVKGVDIEFGAMGQSSAPTYIDVVQASLMALGRRWQMSEGFISGDYSNNNLASQLAAESPFTISMQQAQGAVAIDDVDVLWKVVKRSCDAGRIPVCVNRLRQLVSIKSAGPDITSHDRQQEHAIRQGEHEAGVLSLKTWAAETGRDFEAEQANIAAEPKPQPQPMFGLDPAKLGRQPQPPNPGAAFQSAVEESIRRVTNIGEALAVLTEASDCGANAEGGGGFQPGNDCGGEGGGFTNKKHRTAADISGVTPEVDGLPAKVRKITGYHVTTKENAAAILRGGFDLSKVRPRWRNDFAVSLTTRGGEKAAADYFTRAGEKFDDKKYTVLKVVVKGRSFPAGSITVQSSSAKDYTSRIVRSGWDVGDANGAAYIYNPEAIVSVSAK